MTINLQGILNRLIIKHKDLAAQMEKPLGDKDELTFLASSDQKKAFVPIDNKKLVIKIGLEEVLRELGVKVSEDNLLILHKLLNNKMSLSLEKFEMISEILGKFPHAKEEVLEIIFNPFINLLLIREEDRDEKTLVYLKESKEKKLEIVILYHHPKTGEIIAEIFWSCSPLANIYFTKEPIKDFFYSYIGELKEKLPGWSVNCYYKKDVARFVRKSGYYKLDLKV